MSPRQLSAMEPLFSPVSTMTAMPRWRGWSATGSTRAPYPVLN
jgi:hypothetical protein